MINCPWRSFAPYNTGHFCPKSSTKYKRCTICKIHSLQPVRINCILDKYLSFVIKLFHDTWKYLIRHNYPPPPTPGGIKELFHSNGIHRNRKTGISHNKWNNYSFCEKMKMECKWVWYICLITRSHTTSLHMVPILMPCLDECVCVHISLKGSFRLRTNA